MVYVYYCKNNRLSDEVYMSWLRVMPAAFVQRLNKLFHRHDAQASLLGRMLLLYAVKQLGYPALTLNDIRFNTYQRPYFEHTNMDFNISHSGDYVVCAIAFSNRIGVDIEQVKPINLEDFITLFSQAELQQMTENPEGQLDWFYTFWTQKEALVKAEGSGLNFPVRDINVRNGKAVLAGCVWHLYELELVDGYKVNLAMQQPADAPIAVKTVHATDMQSICE